VVAVVTPRASLLLVVALLGCVRWEPLASASLATSGTTYALQRVRVQDGEGNARELTVQRVEGGALQGWDANGHPTREALAALRQVWLRRPQELFTAALVAGVYAVIFAVSAATLFIDRR
jgi:hypothetical protein